MTSDRGQPDELRPADAVPRDPGDPRNGSIPVRDEPARGGRAPRSSVRRATDLGRRVTPVSSEPAGAGPAEEPPPAFEAASAAALEAAPEPPVTAGVTETGADLHRVPPGGVDDLAVPPAQPPAARPAGRDRSTTARAHPFGRRRLWPVIVAGAIVTGVVVAGLGSSSVGRPTPSPGGSANAATADGYLVSAAELRQRVADAERGVAPIAGAADDLLSWAAKAVTASPHPVQPLVVVGTDNVFVDDATRAYGLSLAYVASGDERFADAAAGTIRAWVETARSADDTCTDDGGCQTTLSISRAAPGLVFGAGLIADSTAWSPHDDAAFRAWLRTVILPAASERTNNWGDAGTFMRVVVTDYLGDQAAFDAAIAKWRSMLDLVEADGRIPEESRRGTAGITYTQEALQYKIAVARIAELRGIDLWDAVGAKGGSIKTALDRLAYYFAHPTEWPDAANAEVPVPGPAWEIAYEHWADPAWLPIVAAVRPYGDRGHSAIRWTTFTNGRAVDPITGAGSPASESAAPTGSAAVPPSTFPSATPNPNAPPPLTALRVALVETAATGKVPVRVSWSAPAGIDGVALQWSTGGSWHDLTGSSRRSGSIVDARPPGTIAYRGRTRAAGETSPWLELADVVTERIDASRTTLTLSGPWSMAGGSGYGGGSALSTSRAGATATWSGTASDLLIVGPVGPTRGQLEVIADGTRMDLVSLRATTYVARRVLAVVHFSSPGSHTLVLRAAGETGRTVAIDEIVRLDSGTLSSPASTP